MRFALHIALGTFVLSQLFSCRSSETYLAYARSIDSLSGAISTLESQLKSVNEGELADMKNRYDAYSTFIKQHLQDTISKSEASDLQRFYEAGKQLDAFVDNRQRLSERAALLKQQLTDLSRDVRLRNTDEERLNEYFMNERGSATEFVNAAGTELTNYVEASKQFKLSLPAVGNIIRKRNNGELPRVVKNNSL
jgi:hypothetical protein